MYTLTNLVAGQLNIGKIHLHRGGTKDIDYMSAEVVTAITAGLVLCTPAHTVSEPVQSDLTIATGTPAAGTVDVGASFNQGTLNNVIATLATIINKQNKSLLALQTQVRAMESRLARANGVPAA
jgi:hypothetical protein